MNLTIKSEKDLVVIINRHFNAEYTFKHCLDMLDSLTIKESRGQLSRDNRVLLAKLEVLNATH